MANTNLANAKTYLIYVIIVINIYKMFKNGLKLEFL